MKDDTKSEAGAKIFERSGSVQTDDPLATFLYLLMRNEVTPGCVEGIMKDVDLTGKVNRLSNGWLASHVIDIASRLRSDA